MYTLKDISLEDIELSLKAVDWKEAIIKASQEFLKRGYITQNYIDSMINSVVEHGPYIVLSENIALAHARPEDGAIKTGLYFTTLDNSIEFGAEEFDPVKMIIVLSAEDSEGHLDLLMELSSILEDRTLVDNLIKQKDKKEFLKLIKGAIE